MAKLNFCLSSVQLLLVQPLGLVLALVIAWGGVKVLRVTSHLPPPPPGADQEHKTDEMHTALMEASMLIRSG